MNSIYLNDWSGEGYPAIARDFSGTRWSGSKPEAEELQAQDNFPKPEEVLLASYAYECYEGDAFVLFVKNGKLFEVNGSHCSCYGLEGQWQPEETSISALRKRLTGDGYGLGRYREALERVVSEMERQGVLTDIHGVISGVLQ